ncbi:hypothetical protein DSM112329_00231 [Paraconexibacter sp. AEG42_29]|uniref:Blue (type 1) copper domain-containing protein n=1 Tax=Paraconexibacter sp. AEG42_29 TaxID=2997339 RepID=A0AAU7AP86_9ACTN
MKSTRLLTTLAVLGALTVAGCGSDDDGGGGGSSTSTPAAASTSTPAAAPSADGTVQVGMKDIKFDPVAVTVKVDQKIVWTNNESIEHNVIAQEGADFESDNFGEGGTYEFTPTEPGTIEYTCTIHPGMDGTITVE